MKAMLRALEGMKPIDFFDPVDFLIPEHQDQLFRQSLDKLRHDIITRLSIDPETFRYLRPPTGAEIMASRTVVGPLSGVELQVPDDDDPDWWPHMDENGLPEEKKPETASPSDSDGCKCPSLDLLHGHGHLPDCLYKQRKDHGEQ